MRSIISMQSLNQYYTEKNVSERISHHIQLEHPPEWCLELGAGLGGLIQPLIKKWPLVKVATCDIDPNNHNYLKKSFPSGNHYLSDVTEQNFESIVSQIENKIDFSVCNPPFSWQKSNNYSKELLSLCFGNKYSKLKTVRSEVIFTIQNLRILKPRGILVLVLPEFIIRGVRLREFRKYLIENHTVCKLIKLEENSFKGTEAQTYALIIKKTKSRNPNIEFVDINEQANLVSHESFVEGHPEQTEFNSFPYKILRGTWTGKKCGQSKLPTFHTTAFKHYPTNKVFLSDTCNPDIHPTIEKSSGFIVAREGDILVARVGTRSLGKVAFVEAGRFIISDCIFIVRLPSFSEARSFFGQHYKTISTKILEAKKGTCAKYITKNDLAHILYSTSQIVRHPRSQLPQ